MNFIRFPHIDNLERADLTKPIDFEKAKTIKSKWLVTEKIDGTNFSINIEENEYRLGKRNSLLDRGVNFYGCQQHIEVFEHIVKKLRELFFSYPNIMERVTVYGEWFGPQILNRVHYGDDSQFRIYAMCVKRKGDDEHTWLPPFDIFCVLRSCELSEYKIPVLGVFDTFEEACAYPNNGTSTFMAEDGKNIMEGIVIQPLTESPFSREYGNQVYKSKNEKFKETMPSKTHKSLKELTEDDKMVLNYKKTFLNFCTESRMYSVISKLGMPNSITENVSTYISAFLDDAWEDFIAEVPKAKLLDKAGVRTVRNIGSLGYKILCDVVQANMVKN